MLRYLKLERSIESGEHKKRGQQDHFESCGVSVSAHSRSAVIYTVSFLASMHLHQVISKILGSTWCIKTDKIVLQLLLSLLKDYVLSLKTFPLFAVLIIVFLGCCGSSVEKGMST